MAQPTFDPLTQCLTCKRELEIREGTLELSYGRVKTVSRYCHFCMCQRLDGLPFTQVQPETPQE